MRQVALMLLLICTAVANAQQNTVLGTASYTRRIGLPGLGNETPFTLLIGNGVSLFLEVDPAADTASSSDFAVKQNDEGAPVMEFQVKIGSPYPVAYEIDLRKKVIRSRTSLYDGDKSETLIVEEQILPINWTIMDETRTIASLECQKAVGVFRGREYTAWFARKIPVQFGPWKLHGLPGLILEAVDKKNEIGFFVKEIKFPAEPGLTIPKINSNNFRTVTLKEYVKSKEKELDKIMAKFSSKLPRGAEFEITSITSNAPELEYEFDQKK